MSRDQKLGPSSNSVLNWGFPRWEDWAEIQGVFIELGTVVGTFLPSSVFIELGTVVSTFLPSSVPIN